MTPLTAAHGLLLGLFLALPWLGRSEWLPWGAEVLFLVGGFQVRVADRRWNALSSIALFVRSGDRRAIGGRRSHRVDERREVDVLALLVNYNSHQYRPVPAVASMIDG